MAPTSAAAPSSVAITWRARRCDVMVFAASVNSSSAAVQAADEANGIGAELGSGNARDQRTRQQRQCRNRNRRPPRECGCAAQCRGSAGNQRDHNRKFQRRERKTRQGSGKRTLEWRNGGDEHEARRHDPRAHQGAADPRAGHRHCATLDKSGLRSAIQVPGTRSCNCAGSASHDVRGLLAAIGPGAFRT